MKLSKEVYAITNPLLRNGDKISSNPDGYVSDVIQSVISIFFIVATVYFVWHFVMAGYRMISSQGDPDKWKAAQKSLLYSLVGLFVVFSIFAILGVVGHVTGIQGLTDFNLKWPSL